MFSKKITVIIKIKSTQILYFSFPRIKSVIFLFPVKINNMENKRLVQNNKTKKI